GNATGYADIPSGTRSVAIASYAGQNLSFGSEQQSTYVLYRDPTGAAAYINLIEGHKDKNNALANKIKIKFVNLAQGSADVTFRANSPTGADVKTGVSFASASQYTEFDTLPTPSTAIYAISNGGYLVTQFSGSLEVPPVTNNLSSGDASANLVVDNLAYAINIKAENRRGIYTQAHIHNAAAGQTGPAVYTVNTDSQNVTFTNAATLSGANEPTPVTTASTGTGRFHFNSKNGLFYNISITRDNSRGFFTLGHFHRGPVGVAGPFVFDFASAVAKQTIAPPADSLRGRNEPAPADTNSKAGGLGTFTLYPDSLVYSIAVARRTETTDTTFTAMHFHNAAAGSNGGIVKDLATAALGNAPWSNTSKTFTGTWKRTDAQPLTDALITEIINGRIYLNVHTTVRTGGAIRSQLKNVPTSTFALSGSWNDATLRPELKDSLAKGLFYVNFHT
ncbi:MAG: CHRD domain-containing protein, partial [Bacteroidota bacterium]